ncbi:fungal hydrophobin-domain-containing protein [Coprinopsis sp. MPI-PUGE-AT-0042]|nr:fungal hydrophobin-domain-containing protein [Coprinopsis sp. MPI-PUGE-AT-0042]
MKFSTFFIAAIAAVATTVSAAPGADTNAHRLARGLPPLPPVLRRATGTEVAKRGQPSSTPGGCSTGPVQCCQSTGHSTDGPVSLILGLLGVVIKDVNLLIGLTCSPINVLGNTCSAKTVCCQDNSFGGLISVGCIPSRLFYFIFLSAAYIDLLLPRISVTL